MPFYFVYRSMLFAQVNIDLILNMNPFNFEKCLVLSLVLETLVMARKMILYHNLPDRVDYQKFCAQQANTGCEMDGRSLYHSQRNQLNI